MAKTVDQIAAWLNKTYPSRNWDQRCQQLMWNIIYYIEGYTRDSQMTTYPTATAARLASKIESTNALAAPVGAMHWWRNPAEGHVAVELGGGRVLMTGTQSALGAGGVMLGNNYGTTTVAAYSKARGNPYLGWSRTNGRNASIVGEIDTGKTVTTATAKRAEALAWPFIWYTVVRGDTMQSIAGRFEMSYDRIMRLNPSVKYPARLQVGARVKVALDHATNWSADLFGIGVDATRAQWRIIQEWLKKLGRYDGVVDGIPARKTWRGVQATVAKYGYYTGPRDGIPAGGTAKGMQQYAAAGGGYTGQIDGILGPYSWAGFVRRLSS